MHKRQHRPEPAGGHVIAQKVLCLRAPRAVSSPARSRRTRLAPRPDRLARGRGEHSVASLHLNRAGSVRSCSISRCPRTALSSPAQRDIPTVNHDPRSSSPGPPIENETMNGQALRPAATAKHDHGARIGQLSRASTRRTGPSMPLPAPGAVRCTKIESRPGRSPRAVSLCSQLAGGESGRRRGVDGQARSAAERGVILGLGYAAESYDRAQFRCFKANCSPEPQREGSRGTVAPRSTRAWTVVESRMERQ
jgi:hypothetical protein